MFSPTSVTGCFALNFMFPRMLFSLCIRRVRLSLDYTGGADFDEKRRSKRSQFDLMSLFLPLRCKRPGGSAYSCCFQPSLMNHLKCDRVSAAWGYQWLVIGNGWRQALQRGEEKKGKRQEGIL